MPPWTQYNRHQCLSLYIVHATIKHITKVQQTKTNNNCCFHFQSQNCGQHQWPHTQSEQPTRTHSNLNACHAIQLISFQKTTTNQQQTIEQKFVLLSIHRFSKTGEWNLYTDPIQSTPHICAYTNATQPSLELVSHP
jgi:hypothetical protein